MFISKIKIKFENLRACISFKPLLLNFQYCSFQCLFLFRFRNNSYRSMHVSLTKWSMWCEMHATAAIFVIAFDCARYFSQSWEEKIKIKFMNTCFCVLLDAASIISHFTVCVQWKQSKMQWKANIWWFVCYFRDFPSLCSFSIFGRDYYAVD